MLFRGLLLAAGLGLVAGADYDHKIAHMLDTVHDAFNSTNTTTCSNFAKLIGPDNSTVPFGFLWRDQSDVATNVYSSIANLDCKDGGSLTLEEWHREPGNASMDISKVVANKTSGENTTSDIHLDLFEASDNSYVLNMAANDYNSTTEVTHFAAAFYLFDNRYSDSFLESLDDDDDDKDDDEDDDENEDEDQNEDDDSTIPGDEYLVPVQGAGDLTGSVSIVKKATAQSNCSFDTNDDDEVACPILIPEVDGACDVLMGGWTIAGMVNKSGDTLTMEAIISMRTNCETPTLVFVEMSAPADSCPPKRVTISMETSDDSPLPDWVFAGPPDLLIRGIENYTDRDDVEVTSDWTEYAHYQPVSNITYVIRNANHKKPIPEELFGGHFELCNLPGEDSKCPFGLSHIEQQQNDKKRSWISRLWHSRKTWIAIGSVFGALALLGLLACLALCCSRRRGRRSSDAEKLHRTPSTSSGGTLAGTNANPDIDFGRRRTGFPNNTNASATGAMGNGASAPAATGAGTGTGQGERVTAVPTGAGSGTERVVQPASSTVVQPAPGTERVVVQPAPPSGTVAAP